MSDHPDLRPLLEGGTLSGATRHALLVHLQCCARCRALLAGQEPERQFGLLKLEPIPQGILDRVSDGVSAELAREAGRLPRRRLLAWGSLAASLLLAGMFGTYLWQGRNADPLPDAAVNRIERREVAFADPAVSASMIKVLDSPGDVDVVKFTVGETELVMIFDEALDL